MAAEHSRAIEKILDDGYDITLSKKGSVYRCAIQFGFDELAGESHAYYAAINKAYNKYVKIRSIWK